MKKNKKNKRKSRGIVSGPYLIMGGNYTDDLEKLKQLQEIDKMLDSFFEGQSVKYEGKETHIETLHGDGTCNIANPDWDYDEEATCVYDGDEYDIPYWITVKLSELETL